MKAFMPLVFGVCLWLTACGGGGGSNSSETAPPLGQGEEQQPADDPNSPAQLTVIDARERSVTLAWQPPTASPSTTGYAVVRNGQEIAYTGADGLRYVDTSVEPGVQYQYAVRARNTRGEWSPPSRGVTAGAAAGDRADTLPPEAPASLLVQSASQTGLTLAWSRAKDNVGVETYSLYRDNAFLVSVQGGAMGYIDTGLVPGRAYRYFVKALDAQGNASGPSPEIVALTKSAVSDIAPDKTPPTVPTNLGVSAISSDRIEVTWAASTDASGISGYVILLNGSQVGVANGARMSFAIEGLRSETDYEVTIVALDSSGNRSTPSSVLRVTTAAKPVVPARDAEPPSVPGDLYVEEVTASSLRLHWRAASDNVAVTGYEIYRDGKSVGVSSATSFADSGLSADTSYRYQVRARDAAANLSALSAVLEAGTTKSGPEATPDTQAPSKPGKPTVTQSGSKLSVAWAAATDNVKVTGYEVYRNGQKVSSTQSANYLDPDVQAATNYVYVVIARDAAGNASSPSDEGVFKTAPPAEPQDLTPPSVPTGLKLGGVSWNQISLAWTPATDNVAVKDYEIFRNGKSLGSVSSTTYVDSAGLAASTLYAYKVRARDTANLLSEFSGEVTAKTSSAPVVADTVAPTAPAGLKQTGATETSISLAWSAATDNVGVVGYRVNRDGALIVTTTPQQLSYTDNARTANTAYVYTVEAADAAGNKSSAASLTARTSADATPPTNPSGLQAVTIAATTISLSWTASTDNLTAVSYRILRGGVQVGSSSTPSFSDSGLNPSTRYTYTVVALDGSGNLSQPSSALTVQTATPPSSEQAWACGTISNSSKPDGSRRLPAGLDNFTTTEKAAQRAAATEVASAVLAALAAGKSYTLPADAKYKNLRYNPKATGTYKPWLKISSVGAAGLTVDLGGANLWLEDNADEGYVGDAFFINTSNLTIKNLSIDYDPLPFIQGRFVSKVNTTTAVIKLDDDFASATPSFSRMPSTKRNETTAYLFDSNCQVKIVQIQGYQGGGVPKFSPFIAASYGGAVPASGLVTIDFGLPVDSMFTDKAGDRIVMGPRFKTAVQLHQSSNITLENINIYAFALPAIYDLQATGQNVYRNIKIIPRPGTTRLVAGVADGIHSTDAAVGPLIENSTFRAMMDDAINVHASFAPVLSTDVESNLTGQNASTVVIGARGVAPIAPFVKPGRTTSVDFFRRVTSDKTYYTYSKDASDYEYVGSRTITAIGSEIPSATILAKIAAPRLWNHFWTDRNGNGMYTASSGTAFKFGLSSPILISDPMVAVFNHHGSGSVIRNNVFENMAVRGIVYQANTGKIYGNKFAGTKGPAVIVGTMPSWNEGPYARNVEMTGNEFCYRFKEANLAVQLRLLKGQPVSELSLHPVADLAANAYLTRPMLQSPVSAYTEVPVYTSLACK